MAVNVAKTGTVAEGFFEQDKRNRVIQKAIENLKENIADGFQLHDLKIYIGTMAIAIEHAGIFFGKSGRQKEGLLVDILSDLINIPFIPHTVERWFFKWSIRKAIKIFNKKGWNAKYLK